MSYTLDNTYTFEVIRRPAGDRTSYISVAEGAEVLLPVLSDIVEKLATKGAPEQVATHMETLGLKAVCGSSEHCAIAEYVVAELLQAIPELTEVLPTVGCSSIEVGYQEGSDRRIASVKTPPMLAEFIACFDHHEFPALEKNES